MRKLVQSTFVTVDGVISLIEGTTFGSGIVVFVYESK
jgi:hypothetical protein